MSLTLIKSTVKVPFKCILEICLEYPELEALYEDLILAGSSPEKHDLRFEGNDYFRNITHILQKYGADGDIVMHNDEFHWAYRFHDNVTDYVTWPNYVKHKLRPIKNDKC